MADDRRVPAATAAAGVLVVALAAWIAHKGEGPVVVRDDGTKALAPYVPTQGDVPTIGHGSTYYEDGRRVTLQDPPITRERARELAAWHLSDQYAKCVVRSMDDTLVLPTELRLAIDHARQYGCSAYASSLMARAYARGDYEGACKGYLSYKYMTSDRRLGAGWQPYTTAGKTRYRFDCSTSGNRICRGPSRARELKHKRVATNAANTRSRRHGRVS